MGDEQPSPEETHPSAPARILASVDAKVKIIVALIGAIGAIAVAALAGAFQNGQQPVSSQANAPTQTGSATASPTPSPSPTCAKRLRITSPSPNQQIANGNDGVLVWVTACELNGDTGWLFDYDPADQTYYLDGSPPFTPVAPSDGIWDVLDQPIGNPGEINTPQTIVLVEAQPSCADALRAAKPDQDQNVTFKTLPGGCSVAGAVNVSVLTYPSAPASGPAAVQAGIYAPSTVL